MAENPSMGTGNFFAADAKTLKEKRVKLYGVELDTITGAIAKNTFIPIVTLKLRALRR